MNRAPPEPSLKQLGARLQDLQARAFAIYEDAARRSEAEPRHRDAFYAQAEADTAPLLAEAERLRGRFVARARMRARRAWMGAYAGIALIVLLLAWGWLRR